MRPVRQLTAEEEGFCLEPLFGKRAIAARPELGDMLTTRRNPVKPEPEGTVVLMAFRITGYDEDCDGSLMARLEQIDKDGNTTGWEPRAIGIGPDTDIVCSLDELAGLFRTDD